MTHSDGDPRDEQPLERLEADICELAGQLAAGTCRWLTLVAEFDRREGWAQWGVRSCAHWLSWRCGLAPGAAREHVRVARALQALPLVAAAFGDGRLSYAKVRALSRVATAETESELVDLALAGTASQLERIVRSYRRVARCEQTGIDRRHAERYLRWHYDDDGALVLRARLAPEQGALVLAALAAARESGELVAADTSQRRAEPGEDVPAGTSSGPSADTAQDDRDPRRNVPAETSETGSDPAEDDPDPRRNVPAGTSATSGAGPAPERDEVPPEVLLGRPPVALDGGDAGAVDVPAGTPAMSNADALVTLAETLLATGPAHLHGADRYQVVVHVDLSTLRASLPLPAKAGGGARWAETEDGIGLLPETLARLGCDSSLLAVVEDTSGSPLDVGRKTRAVPAGIRRALRCRDRGCRFPGCSERRHVDAHHIVHWAHGGPTSLANLVLLCEFHHRQVHESGFVIVPLGSGRFRFLRPDGQPVPDSPPPVVIAGRLEDAQRDLEIDDETIVSGWHGERLDLDAALFALLNPPAVGPASVRHAWPGP